MRICGAADVVLIVMDQYTRRIVGFGIQAGIINGHSYLTWPLSKAA
jgi:hypothetical protein